MQLHVIAVGGKMPQWVQTGVDEYCKRMPAHLAIRWHDIRAEARNTGGTAQQCMSREARRVEQALPKRSWVVVLDENGKRHTTQALSTRLAHWQELGQDVSLIVGGPDGIDANLKQSADETLRLSDLTLPHPLVRIVLAEQLYRAWSILENHPYHRA